MNPTLQMELQAARRQLRLAQANLLVTRASRKSRKSWIRDAEAEVCRRLDRVWEAQENYKAAVRHFA